MSRPSDFDARLRAWLDEGTSSGPEQLLLSAFAEARSTRQERPWLHRILNPTRSRATNLVVKFAVVMALTIATAAAAVGIGARLLHTQTAVLPAPFGPATNGSIVYGKDGDIWTRDADGGNPRLLITGPDNDIYPLYSPDGSKILFERHAVQQPRRVMVANADGSDIHPIANVQGQAEDWQWTDWSPDSRSVVVLWGAIGGGQAISILSADGGPVRTLDLGGLWPTEFVGWLPPDGLELVFEADRGGVAPRGIYAIRPDGTGLRTIAVSQDAACQDCPFQQPALSPDGRLMAYQNWEANDAGVAGGYLHLRDLASGDDEVFAPYPDYPGVGFSSRFSPDGDWLLFESGPHDQAGKALEATGAVTGQLVLAPLEGDEPARLMGDWYTDDGQTSEFSPDGTMILQDRGAGGSWLIDVATGTSTPTEEYVLAPSWRRDAP